MSLFQYHYTIATMGFFPLNNVSFNHVPNSPFGPVPVMTLGPLPVVAIGSFQVGPDSARGCFLAIVDWAGSRLAKNTASSRDRSTDGVKYIPTTDCRWGDGGINCFGTLSLLRDPLGLNCYVPAALRLWKQ